MNTSPDSQDRLLSDAIARLAEMVARRENDLARSELIERVDMALDAGLDLVLRDALASLRDTNAQAFEDLQRLILSMSEFVVSDTSPAETGMGITNGRVLSFWLLAVMTDGTAWGGDKAPTAALETAVRDVAGFSESIDIEALPLMLHLPCVAGIPPTEVRQVLRELAEGDPEVLPESLVAIDDRNAALVLAAGDTALDGLSLRYIPFVLSCASDHEAAFESLSGAVTDDEERLSRLTDAINAAVPKQRPLVALSMGPLSIAFREGFRQFSSMGFFSACQEAVTRARGALSAMPAPEDEGWQNESPEKLSLAIIEDGKRIDTATYMIMPWENAGDALSHIVSMLRDCGIQPLMHQ